MEDNEGHVRESGRPNDERLRRRRGALVLGVLVAVLVVGLVVAVLWNRQAGQEAARPAAPTCTPTAAPTPGDVTVNVRNATDRTGLAASAAKKLKDQGFTVQSTGNDPTGAKVSGAAEVRYGPKGTSYARTLAARAPGAKLVQDKRDDASVDLVLGPDFTDVTKPKSEPRLGC